VNVLPVIQRELRAEARNPHHHWLRLIGAAVVLVYFYAVSRDYRGPGSLLGQTLFGALAVSSMIITAVLTPQLTADCLSREKREGTLGLLFLTPLKAREIVIAKSAVHLLRSFTVLTSLGPLFAIPLLMGGVQFRQVVLAVTANVFAAFLGLAAGLIASVRNTEWMRAAVSAEFTMLVGASFLAPFLGAFSGSAVFSGRAGWLFGPILVIGLAVVFLWVSIVGVSTHLQESWQRSLIDPPQPRWTRSFSESALMRSLFRWNKARVLDRNPIAWLQEYSWTARLTKWGWLLLAIFGEVAGPRNVMWALIGAFAFAAAGSFRRELQSGSLELLLVTPLRESQLISGRLWGLFSHFLPAVLVWTTFRVFAHVMVPGTGSLLLDLVTMYSSLLTVPLIGCFLSFCRFHVISGCLLCLLIGVVIPEWLVQMTGEPGPRMRYHAALRMGILFAILQFGAAAVALVQLRLRLAKRSFVTGAFT
jgi:ABC-type transport system involved in multi-copper enzyme maturation permease subunit